MADEVPGEGHDRLSETPAPVVCISQDDFFHVSEGRLAKYGAELTDEARANAALTMERVNTLIAIAAADGVEFTRHKGTGCLVSSGWRPFALNENTRGASKTSNHVVCRACDIYDPDGKFDRWCIENERTLEAVGLWQEDPHHTFGWCHLQTVPPGSKVRVFLPNGNPPLNPDTMFANWKTDFPNRVAVALSLPMNIVIAAASSVVAPAIQSATESAILPDAPPQPAPAPKAKPAPESKPQQPMKPIATSRTLWAAIIAGILAIVEILRTSLQKVADLFPVIDTPYGPFKTVWILLGLILLMLVIIIWARIDDRAKRRR